MNWFEIANVQEVDTPALAVFPDRVQKNIGILKSMLPDVSRLRPHVKTHKSSEVTRMLLESGFTQFKCATIAEAEMLGEAKAPDVLMAYQPLGPKARRLAELVRQFPDTKFSCLVDNLATAKQLSTVFRENNHRLPLYIDLNIGMDRTGIKPGADAEILYRACHTLPGVVAVGLHAYDGHLRDADLAVRTKKSNEGFAPVLDLQKKLSDLGSEQLIVVGGTTTFPIHAQRKNVICSPGTFIYWDYGYHATFREQPFEFGAVIVTRVLSKPTDDLICIDLGHKAVASENALDKRIHFLNAHDLTPVGHSEEHMVLRAAEPGRYQVGDILYGIPFHICPTVALYDAVNIVRNNQASDRWLNRARNRRITY